MDNTSRNPMSLIRGGKPRLVLHPMIFLATYVLSMAINNGVTPAGFVRPLLVAIVIAAGLTLVGWRVLGNRWDGALLASGLIAAVVSPIPLASLWRAYVGVFGSVAGTAALAGTLTALLGVAGIYVLRCLRRGVAIRRPAADSMHVVSAALLVTVVGSSLLAHPAVIAPQEPPSSMVSSPGKPPDIVLILLDGYPRTDVLQRRLNTDDKSFLDALRVRGFDVAATSRSNYSVTELTLPSMFGMEYLDEVPFLQRSLDSVGNEMAALRTATEAGRVFSTLRSAGYRVEISSPGWEHVTLRNAADRMVDGGELTDLERGVLHQTWLFPLLTLATPGWFTASQRDRIVHGFDSLDAFARERRTHPTFLFLHVPAPHLPLVVQADGSATQLPLGRFGGLDRQGLGMTDFEFEAAWASELAYVHKRVLNGIDLLSKSDTGRHAAIVIMADHGYNFEVRPDDLQARFGNLFAARTPGAPGLLGSSPTPVNLFRLLFDRYLGTQLHTLRDRYFVSPSAENALPFHEIDNPEGTPSP